MIRQGDVFLIDLGEPEGSAPGYLHPHVIIQNNLFNQSRINSIMVCGITSNVKRASAPGNVLLNRGEAGLPRPSVVLVTQVFTIDKSHLGAYIGSLSSSRLHKVLDGIHLATEPRNLV
jgi:mRNA interferase MazF